MPFISGEMAAKIAASVFGMTLNVTPQLHYLTKLLGIYAAVFGVLALMVAARPVEYRQLTFVIVALYAARILNRVIFLGQFMDAFQATAFRAWSDIVLLALFGGAALLLMPPKAPAHPA
jgi:hypothetical protein